MHRFALLCGAVVVIGASPAFAHVRLNSPNGGELLEVGEVFEIEWQVVIRHNLQNWDLFYSTQSDDGPWTTIALNLPPGDGSPGSIHTYDWTIPDDRADDAWVRVIMDNSGVDYIDVSDASFAIVPAPAPLVVLGCAGLLGLGRRRR